MSSEITNPSPGSPAPASRCDAAALAWAAAVVALAAALRIATLGRWPLWIDEAFTLHDAYEGPPSYPLGYLMARLAAATLGDGEASLRLIPCLAGIATVALLATWGRDAAELRRARLAATIMALSSWHLFWSQSARYYAPLVLLLVVAARLLRPNRERRGAGRAAAAALALACAAAFHPTAAFFVPGALLLALGRSERGEVRRPAARWLLPAIGLIGALAVARYGHLLSVHLRYKGPGVPAQLVTSYGFQAGPLLLAASALGAVAVVRDARREGAGWRGLLTPGTTFGALTGLLFLGASFGLFVTGYHAIGTLPFVALLAARGALSGPLSGARGVRFALALALLLEQTLGLVLYHGSHGMRPRHREAAEIVRADPGAAVYATREEPLAYYLSEERRILRDPPEARPVEPRLLDDLVHAASAHEVLWVVVHRDDVVGWTAAERAVLDGVLAGSEHRSLPGSFGPKELTLDLYRVERAGGAR